MKKLIYVLIFMIACCVSFYASADHSCEIKDGKVVCWGDNSYRQCIVPELKNPAQVAVGNNFSCALDDNGVKCWGANTWKQTDVPFLIRPRQIAVGSSYACALDESGVKCWGDNQHGQTKVPPLRKVTQLTANGDTSCVEDISETGVRRKACWGKERTIEVLSPSVDGFENIVKGHYHQCGFYNNTVECWGKNDSGQSNAPLFINPIQVVVGSGHTCALNDDGVKCWGFNKDGQINVPPLRKILELSATYSQSCAIDESSGGVKRKVCWGEKNTIEILSPSLDQFTDIVQCSDRQCGFYKGLLECWGANYSGYSDVPPLKNPVQVAIIGYLYTCSFDDNGVKCWGSSDTSEVLINNAYGEFFIIARNENSIFYKIEKDVVPAFNDLSEVSPMFLSYVFKNELRFFYSFDKLFGEKLFRIFYPGSKYSKLMALFHFELKKELGLLDTEEGYKFLWNKYIYLPIDHEFFKEAKAPENNKEKRQILNVFVESIKTTMSLMTDEYKQRASSLILRLSNSVNDESLKDAAEFVIDAGINPYIRPRMKLQLELIRLLGL